MPARNTGEESSVDAVDSEYDSGGGRSLTFNLSQHSQQRTDHLSLVHGVLVHRRQSRLWPAGSRMVTSYSAPQEHVSCYVLLSKSFAIKHSRLLRNHSSGVTAEDGPGVWGYNRRR